MNNTARIKPLFAPRAIAVVGASDKPGPGSQVIENLKTLGYEGAIIPVNPRYETVNGLKCYASLTDTPAEQPIDCVAIVLGYRQIPAILKQAAAKGVRAAWAFASGYAETGKEGAGRQLELSKFCQENQIAFCGPNCVGFANLHQKAAAFSAPISPALKKGNIAAIGQSGSVILALANANRGLGFSTLVSSGNEAVLDTSDYIQYFIDDDQTQVIMAFLEGIRKPEAFIRACERAASVNKPIVALKVGRSEMARRTVVSHTGALAGSDAVHDALFKRLGVIRVDDLDQMFETAEILSRLKDRLPKGNRVGAITVSGGEIGLMGDLSRGLPLEFPALSDQAVKECRDKLPDFSNIANPLDAWGSGDLSNTYAACLEVLAGEKHLDILAVSQDAPPGMAEKQIDQYALVARAVARVAKNTEKPVLVFSHVSTGLEPKLKAVLDEAKVPMLQGTLESLKAMSHLAAYAEFQRERAAGQARPEATPLSPETRGLIQGKKGVLSHQDGLALLQQMGITELCPQGLARDESAAKGIAEKLGYPVVVKGQSAAIPHKTEAGLVKLGISDQAQLEKALEKIKTNARAYDPKAKLEGFLIQKMAPADQSVEVIVGVNHDPLFGPVVVLGLGGIFVELLKDVQLGLAPLSRAEALKMIHSLKKSELFEEFRGRPPVDKEALADLLVKVGEMALNLGGRLSSLDLNPVMVLPRGQGVWAVDTLIELQPAD